MPSSIRQFITSLPPNIKTDWALLTNELLTYFGKQVEEENRELVASLRKCTQSKDESVPLYSARWQHLISKLPEQHFNMGQKIQLFIKGLADISLRTSLLSGLITVMIFFIFIITIII
jgi:hypothetical protein